MSEIKTRRFRLGGDEIDVIFSYDKETDMYFGDYPDFSEQPRFTPEGRPWVNVTKEDCTHGETEFGDCGSCPHFCTEQHNDLIGICLYEENVMQLE